MIIYINDIIYWVGSGPEDPVPGGGAVQQSELRQHINKQLRLG